jgi:hypothetical protein
MRIALLSLVGLAALAAGCGTTADHLTTVSEEQIKPVSLATSVTTTAGTWAVALVGGKASEDNNFWQLLVRPAATGTWKLATPPGVASNGGLLIAPLKGDSLVAGFRPSQDLRFTPLASTADTGRSWSAGVLDAGVADGPSALAGDPATGDLLALLADGSVERGSAAGHWSVIGTRSSLNTNRNGRCGLMRLTGVTLTVNGTPLAASDCTRPGVAGIFGYFGGTWQFGGPSMQKTFRRDDISVLALTTVAGHTLALLQAGTGAEASVLVAEAGASGWSDSGPDALHGASVSSLATSADGEIGLVLTNGSGLLLVSPTSTWQTLPRLPRRTQTLAFGPGAKVQALVPARTSVSFFDYQPVLGTWVSTQKLKIPVQFGSSS